MAGIRAAADCDRAAEIAVGGRLVHMRISLEIVSKSPGAVHVEIGLRICCIHAERICRKPMNGLHRAHRRRGVAIVREADIRVLRRRPACNEYAARLIAEIGSRISEDAVPRNFARSGRRLRPPQFYRAVLASQGNAGGEIK